MIKMSRDTKWPKGQQIIKHVVCKDVIHKYHLVEFGAYRYCEGGDVTFLKCHVIPRDITLRYHPVKFDAYRSFKFVFIIIKPLEPNPPI